MTNLFHRFADRFSCDLAIDMGSTNTLIYRKGRGILVNEPSLIAYDRSADGIYRPIRTGAGAKELLADPSDGQIIVKPVQYGAVSDFSAAREMLGNYLDRIKRGWCSKPVRVIANVPVQASEREKGSIREVIRSAGAGEVYLLEEARAVAIGAGLDISDEKRNMVVDIGGAITEMAVIAEGRIVRARSHPIGGEHMDQAIADHIRNRYRLRIMPHMAEQVKIALGDACPGPDECSVRVSGYHIAADIPGSVLVTSWDIREALTDTITSIISAIKEFIALLAPEETVDILDRGIALAGGGALLRGLDRLLERELLFPFFRVKDPLACPVLGSAGALDYLDQFRQADQN